MDRSCCFLRMCLIKSLRRAVVVIGWRNYATELWLPWFCFKDPSIASTPIVIWHPSKSNQRLEYHSRFYRPYLSSKFIYSSPTWMDFFPGEECRRLLRRKRYHIVRCSVAHSLRRLSLVRQIQEFRSVYIGILVHLYE